MLDSFMIRLDSLILWLRIDMMFFFFKQKTAYEMRISDWSSDVCSSDLFHGQAADSRLGRGRDWSQWRCLGPQQPSNAGSSGNSGGEQVEGFGCCFAEGRVRQDHPGGTSRGTGRVEWRGAGRSHRRRSAGQPGRLVERARSEEHTSEL